MFDKGHFVRAVCLPFAEEERRAGAFILLCSGKFPDIFRIKMFLIIDRSYLFTNQLVSNDRMNELYRASSVSKSITMRSVSMVRAVGEGGSFQKTLAITLPLQRKAMSVHHCSCLPPPPTTGALSRPSRLTKRADCLGLSRSLPARRTRT